MTTRAWVGLCFAMLLAIACRDRVDAAAEARKLTPTSKVDATAPLVDEDFRFRLAWPGEGWKVVHERDARRLNHIAVAALLHADVTALVIVEPLPGLEREAYTQLVIDNLAFADKHSSVEVRQVDGRDESYIVVSGNRDGRTTTVHGRLFAHQGYGYQVLAIQLGETPQTALAEQALAAFSLTDGPVSGRSDAATGDLDGLGWRLRGDRLEHGPAGLRVAVPPDWIVLPESDLARVSRNAAIGLKTKRGGMYLTVIVEPVNGVRPAAYIANRRATLDKVWIAQGDPVAMAVGRASIELLRAHGDVGIPSELLWGAVVVGQRGYQVSIWYPQASGAELRPKAPEVLAAIEFLDDRTTAALVAELTAVPDRRVVVGDDFSLRGGVYRDFKHRLHWHHPPGLWRVIVGDDARAINPSIRIHADDAVAGTSVQLVAEPWDGDLASYEAAAVRPTSPLTASGATTVRGHAARYLEWNLETATMSRRVRNVLVVDGGRAVQVITWALASAWPSPTALTAIADGLELVDAMPVTEPGPPYRDHRYGFAVTVPSEWVRSSSGSRAKPAGVVCQWSHGSAELLVIANYSPDSDGELAVELAVELAEQTFREHLAPLGDAASERETADVAGRPGTRVTWRSDAGRAELQLVRRGDVMYGVLAVAHEDDAAIAVGRAALTLLD